MDENGCRGAAAETCDGRCGAAVDVGWCGGAAVDVNRRCIAALRRAEAPMLCGLIPGDG